jgi:hypothetical protein
MPTELALAYFGSVLKLARFLGVAPQTVYRWKEYGEIPKPWDELLELKTNGDLKRGEEE